MSPAIIIGLLPVAVILIGNMQSKEVPLARLLPGGGLITIGFIVLNSFSLDSAARRADSDNLLGIGSSVIALLLLTIYCISNANYLKANAHISSSRWATILGICALLHSILFVLASFLFTGRNVLTLNFMAADRLFAFAVGTIFLGVFVSYVAMWMWNIASRSISDIMAGKILCFETIFALVYGYMIDSRAPESIELSSVCLILVGAYIVQQHSDKQRIEGVMN